MTTRLKFSCVGNHVTLPVILNQLIVENKLEQVPLGEPSNFVLIGAEYGGSGLGPELLNLIYSVSKLDTTVPALVLSTGAVYSDRTDLLDVSDYKVMSEGRGLVITSILSEDTPATLFSLTVENLVLQAFPHTLVLRVFDVYGPEIPGIVSELLAQAVQGKPLDIPAPGYQTRTYLHIDDFVQAFDKLLPKFLQRGVRGIYNIGAIDEVSYVRLADSIWQLARSTTEASPRRTVGGHPMWWCRPDITRIQALLKWAPTTTLRKGLWRMVHEYRDH